MSEIVGAHEQGSAAWKAARSGCLNASQLFRVMGGSTAGLDAVRKEIRVFRKTGKTKEIPANRAMTWGNDHEAQARSSVEMTLGYDFQQVGTIVHDDLFYVGASPDGLNYERKQGLELKCPWRGGIHISYVVRRKIPKVYLWQCQAGMFVTGFDSWIFASFDPRRLADGNDTLIHTIKRSETMIAMMEERLPWFWGTV
ncbi:MAG: hypothetical protein E4G89_00335 [Methanothrix sp.]|nr:MAG: hypothetical protein E4G89_00335 [Methanothrix sp.]